MADLSQLSNEDLLALKAGDLTKVSDKGLLALKGSAPAMTSEQPAPRGTFGQNLLMDTTRRLATGGPLSAFGGASWDLMNKAQDMYSDAAHEAGAKTTDAAMALGANPNVAAGVGTGVNVAMNALPMVGGGGGIGKVVGPAVRGMAENLMQSAVKPIWKDLKTGEAKRAVQTMLDEGISATESGLTKLRAKISEINDEIETLIKNSSGTVNKQEVADYAKKAFDRFRSQVNPESDLAKIEMSRAEFLRHPDLQQGEKTLADLNGKLASATDAKVNALQDAGRFATAAAQQRNLAHGGGIGLHPNQPVNAPFFNVGNTGGRSISPQAYPTSEASRIPGRYTENIQRVPEAEQATADAMNIYRQRQNQEKAAQEALDQFYKNGGADAVPVQLAQKIKQGTYRVLSGKYGEVSSAEDTAQKMLSLGLKEGVAKAVPEVAALNARESNLLSALSVAERRILYESNKNPMGLALIAHDPKAMLAFMGDRSAAFKSIIARILNAGSEAAPATLGAAAIGTGQAINQAGRKD